MAHRTLFLLNSKINFMNYSSFNLPEIRLALLQKRGSALNHLWRFDEETGKFKPMSNLRKCSIRCIVERELGNTKRLWTHLKEPLTPGVDLFIEFILWHYFIYQSHAFCLLRRIAVA